MCGGLEEFGAECELSVVSGAEAVLGLGDGAEAGCDGKFEGDEACGWLPECVGEGSEGSVVW